MALFSLDSDASLTDAIIMEITYLHALAMKKNNYFVSRKAEALQV
jgi:hypothetical protein